MIPSLIVAMLILMNALFVAAEFAIVGASRTDIERRVGRGGRLARRVQDVLADARAQDRYVATAQLGITSASLALGMYGEHQLADWLAGRLEGLGAIRWIGAHALGSAGAIAFLTYLHIVLGEMVPKALALQAPERVATAIAYPMRLIELALYPLVVGLNGIANAALRLAGIERTAGGEEPYHTADELSFVVSESRAHGQLAREPARVIQELLEFGELRVGQIMVPRTRVVSLPLGAGRDEIRDILAAERHTRYPVHEDGLDRIVGTVHVKDLLEGFGPDGRLAPEQVREAPFLPATEPLDRVLAEMRHTRSHMAVIMDEHGGTAGIVTLENLFEEVAGEIAEPGELRPIRRDAGGVTQVAGTIRLEELGEALGRELGHEEVDTVSGLVIALLGRPARVGDRVEYEGIGLEVTAVRGKGVREARVLEAPDRA